MERRQADLRQAGLRGGKKVDLVVQRIGVPEHPMGLPIDQREKGLEKVGQKVGQKANPRNHRQVKVVRNHHAIPKDLSSMLWNSMLMAMESLIELNLQSSLSISHLHHHLLLLKVVRCAKAPEAPMLEEVNAHDVPVSRIDGRLMNRL